MFHVLLEPLLFWQRSPPLNLLAFEFAPQRVLLVAFNPRELAQSPRLELALGVDAVCIVYVWDFGFFLLYCSGDGLSDGMISM